MNDEIESRKENKITSTGVQLFLCLAFGFVDWIFIFIISKDEGSLYMRILDQLIEYSQNHDLNIILTFILVPLVVTTSYFLVFNTYFFAPIIFLWILFKGLKGILFTKNL